MKTFAQSWFHFCSKGDPVFWQLDFLLYTISLRYESRCINSFHQPCSLNLQSGSCTSIGLEIWKKLSESSDFWKFPLEGEIGLVTKMVIMWSIVMVHTILFWTKTNEIWIFYILFRPLLPLSFNSGRNVLFQSTSLNGPKRGKNVKIENKFEEKLNFLLIFVQKSDNFWH